MSKLMLLFFVVVMVVFDVLWRVDGVLMAMLSIEIIFLFVVLDGLNAHYGRGSATLASSHAFLPCAPVTSSSFLFSTTTLSSSTELTTADSHNVDPVGVDSILQNKDDGDEDDGDKDDGDEDDGHTVEGSVASSRLTNEGDSSFRLLIDS